jgi:hypothetical protein
LTGLPNFAGRVIVDKPVAFGIKALRCADLPTLAKTAAVRYNHSRQPVGWAWKKIKVDNTKKIVLVPPVT